MESPSEAQLRDEGRCEATVQLIKDALVRFEDMAETGYSVYDLLGYLLEDLVADGCCAACIHETLKSICKDQGTDLGVHRQDDDTIYH